MIKDFLKRFCEEKQPKMHKKLRSSDHYKSVTDASCESSLLDKEFPRTKIDAQSCSLPLQNNAPDVTVERITRKKCGKTGGHKQSGSILSGKVVDQLSLESTINGESLQNQKKQRFPTCAKCRNHNKIVPSKYHKQHCEFKDCPCQKCAITNMKRLVLAKQVFLSRCQAQDEAIRELKKQGKFPENHDPVSLENTSSQTSGPASSFSAFTPTQASGITTTELCALQQSLYKIIESFKQYHHLPTFIHTLYLTILKDNGYDHQTVIQKITEGDNEYRKLGLSLQVLKTVPSPSPTNSYWPNVAAAAAASSSPSTSSPFLTSIHPHCYSTLYPSNYPFSYSQSSAAIMSSIPTHGSHASIEAAAATPYNFYFHHGAPYPPTTPPSSATSNSIIPDVVTRVYTPPNRHPTDGHTSGDSRGSPEYKEESDKEAVSGGGNGAPLPPTTVRDSTSLIDIHRRSRTFRPYPVPWQDRVETAANA